MKMKRTKLLVAVFGLLLTTLSQAQDLMDVYRLAMENDPLIREAKEKLLSVTENKAQAQARLLPNIALSANANALYTNVKNAPDSTQERSQNYGKHALSLSLQQPIYHREYRIQIEQADNLIAQAQAEYEAARQDLMARTIQAYFDVLAAQDDLEVSKSKKEANQRQLDQAKQRFEVGLIAITDVHEAQAAFDSSRADEIAKENAVDNAWEALYEIIGQHNEPLAKLGDKLPLSPPVPADLEQWSKVALEQNYGIIAAINTAEASRKTVEIQRSSHYPTLDLVGSIGTDHSDADLGSDTDSASIGLQLNIPIYQGGAVNSRTRQAMYDYQAAKEALDRKRREVNRQVRNAYRGVLSTISQVDALKATTISARSALESTQAGYEVGTRTLVDVLTVQSSMFEARRNYLASRYQYIINGLLLKQAASTLAEEDLSLVNGWLQQ